MLIKLQKITEIATLLKSAMFPSYQSYLSQILKEQIKDINEDFVKFNVSIFYTIQEISHKRALRSGRLIVLNNSSSLKMVIKMYFIFLKDIELFECR